MMFIGKISLAFLSVAFLGKCLSAQSTIEAFYFTDTATGTIQRSNAEGKDIQTVLDGLGDPEQIAIDSEANKIFWVDSVTDTLECADLEGGNRRVLVRGLKTPRGVVLDSGSQQVYLTDFGSKAKQTITKVAYDGTARSEVYTAGAGSTLCIALDNRDRRLYWTDNRAKGILSCRLDGSDLRTIISGLREPYGIALDEQNRKLYWTDRGSKQILRSDLDGSNREVLIEEGVLTEPKAIVLDVPANQFYWIDETKGSIYRSTLEGKEISLVVGGLKESPGLAALRRTQEKGIFFDGFDDFVRLPMINFNEFQEGFTIEVWCQNWGGYILSQGSAGEPENSIWMSTAAGLWDGCGWESNQETPENLAIVIPDIMPNQWMHVALVYDGRTQALFVDGKVVGKVECAPPGTLTSDRPLVLGAEPRSSNKEQWGYGSGLLRAVRISTKPRYTDNFEPQKSWENDEATELLVTSDGVNGNTVVDQSQHNRSGELAGARVVSRDEIKTKVIEGRVVRADGQPVDKAFVSLVGQRKMAYETRTSTDGAGRFRVFVNDPSASYSLRAFDRTQAANGRWSSSFVGRTDTLKFSDEGTMEVVITVEDIDRN